MQEAVKTYTHGTHRVRSPEQTWDWLSKKLDTVGITRVAHVTHLDRLGIPVYQAIRPASRNLAVSQGKALTAEGARVGCCMESMELWHAESLEHLERRRARVPEIFEEGGGQPIAVDSLPWRAGVRDRHEIELDWLWAQSWTGPGAWLPRQMFELDLMLPTELGAKPFRQDSNGLASGNCLEEAHLHALCELIERHAIYMAQRPSKAAKPVPLIEDSIDDPECRHLIERMRSAGMKLTIYDLTWDVQVPVVMVDLVADDLPNIWHGSGCHPSRRVALSRALTEAAQVRLAYISGARDDIKELPEGDAGEIFAGYIEEPGRRRLDELADFAGRTVDEDVAQVVERLAGAGHRAYHLDISRAGIDVPVVRTFVPGLRAGFA